MAEIPEIDPLDTRPRRPGRNGGTLVSGTKKGRKVSIISAISKILENDLAMDQLAKAIVREAQEGNGTAIRELFNRIDGPVVNRINISELPDEKLMELLAGEGELDADAGAETETQA